METQPGSPHWSSTHPESQAQHIEKAQLQGYTLEISTSKLLTKKVVGKTGLS